MPGGPLGFMRLIRVGIFHEVLEKAEKYINGEEALISKKGSSSTHKEKSGIDKRRGRGLKRQSDRERSLKKDGERSPKRRGNLRYRGNLNLKDDNVIHLGGSPP